VSPTTIGPSVEPVLGPLARRAARLPPSYPLEKKHRLLLTLIAAYADAGEQSPPVRELARRLGLGNEPGAARKIDKRLRGLERAGVLTVAWRASNGGRNVYTLHLDGEGRR
jgi:hypothetical protein